MTRSRSVYENHVLHNCMYTRPGHTGGMRLGSSQPAGPPRSLTFCPAVGGDGAVGQSHEHPAVQVDDGVSRRAQLHLHLGLLDAHVVGAVVDVDAAVLGAEPHGGLVGRAGPTAGTLLPPPVVSTRRLRVRRVRRAAVRRSDGQSGGGRTAAV